MLPKEWTPLCGSCCTKKYANLIQIPWRVFCKKGCDTDGETWEECLGECNEICYKDPVFKDHQWSAYIDRSPGDDNYSLQCFHACVSGCGFKYGKKWSRHKKTRLSLYYQGFSEILLLQFDIPIEKVEQVRPNRPPKRPTVRKHKPAVPDVEPTPTSDDLPCTSA